MGPRELAADHRIARQALDVRFLSAQHGDPRPTRARRKAPPAAHTADAERALRKLATGTEKRRPLSAKTVSYIHTTLHKALADAVDAGVLGRNVADRAKPPRPSRRSTQGIQTWEPHELAGFLASVRDSRLGPIWRLAAMTGMRRGEILGLRWSDLDLAAARLSVRHAVVAVAYTTIESTPKSHNARVIDLDPETVEELRGHRQRQHGERAEWGADYQDGDLVVTKENGEPIQPHTFSQSFERLIRKASLRPIRLHDLRHTHATLALKAGVPVKVVSERLGHESPAFTLKQYAHVLPGMQAEAARSIAALVAASEPTYGAHGLPSDPGANVCSS